MTNEEIENLPISLDTALEIIGIIQGKTKGKKFQQLEKEKNIILGLVGSKEQRERIFKKISTTYSQWVKEFFSIPSEYCCNPFDFSASGDLFFADKRNVDKLNKSIQEAKKGRTINIKTKEELSKLLDQGGN